jgi:hypothetical protein
MLQGKMMKDRRDMNPHCHSDKKTKKGRKILRYKDKLTKVVYNYKGWSKKIPTKKQKYLNCPSARGTFPL